MVTKKAVLFLREKITYEIVKETSEETEEYSEASFDVLGTFYTRCYLIDVAQSIKTDLVLKGYLVEVEDQTTYVK